MPKTATQMVKVVYTGPNKAIKTSPTGEEHPANGDPFEMEFAAVKVMQSRGHHFRQIKTEDEKPPATNPAPATAAPTDKK